MNLKKELSDTLVITKRFRSANEFSHHIDELVSQQKLTYIEAVISYCDKMDIDIEVVKPLINKKLKHKIQIEAEEHNMLKPRGL